ncbi:hypothetical protein [Pseudonocardia parietis]|uniref:Sensory transduction regulator n=1 Tax=Pseudonocardia parietis TaxID=570936 RepID=A0ABS4W300_9PSEU|nr:hypothetical protein [Pseudonocardia parietis]MBP2370574.1 hypothetical protein [Pseudonocardia parietis]
MTTPHSSELPALHTDADVHERVSMLVGTAVTDRQLWIMFLDGDGVQAPVLMPIAEMPAAPDPGIVDRLAEVLGSLHGDLATEQGPGSVVLTWERRGPDRPQPADRAWGRALLDACGVSGTRCLGTFLSTPAGVIPLS